MAATTRDHVKFLTDRILESVDAQERVVSHWQTECERHKTRAAQLENTLHAIADHIDKYGVMYEADPVWNEARALPDGDSAPADTDDDARLRAVADAADAVYGRAGWIGVPSGYRSVPHDLVAALGQALLALKYPDGDGAPVGPCGLRGCRHGALADTEDPMPDQTGVVQRGPTRGSVMEDRWGLRWRADTAIPSGRGGWQCRSVGLRTFITDEQMQERGPLKFVRLDQVFAGDEAKAARQAGEAADAEVTVEGDAAEDAVSDP